MKFRKELTAIVFQEYSDNWRRNRKRFQQEFRQAVVDRFYPAQYAKVHEFLYNSMREPDKFMQHTMAYASFICFLSRYPELIHSSTPTDSLSESCMLHSMGLILAMRIRLREGQRN
jgi:hypothetical protein